MLSKVVDTTLLFAIVIGAVFAYQANERRRPIVAEFQRLNAKVGLPIRDRSKIHVRALETEGDLDFAWHVYIPANLVYQWDLSRSAYEHLGPPRIQPQAIDLVARLSLRERSDGVLEMYAENSGSCHYDRWGKTRLKTMRGRWNELEIETLEPEDVVVLADDEIAALLRVSLPEHLKDEVRLVTSPLQPRELLVFRIGSQQAFQQEGAKKEAMSAR